MLNRDWFINVTNNAAATIRLYLTDEEFQELIDAGGPLQLNDFTLLKVSEGTCGNFSGGAVSILNPVYTRLDFEGNNHLLEFKITSFSGLFPRSDAAVLPIEMAYFTGEPLEKHNLLRWGSALEENTKVHHIERLLPGERDWQSRGTLPAAGFSQQLTTYEWQDFAPYPLAYYRIKTIDFDGSAQYSDLLTLERKNDPIRLEQAYPNPVQTQLTSPIFTLDPTAVAWKIVSPGGQVLLAGQKDLMAGNNLLVMDLSQLKPGLYYLRMTTSGQEFIQKVIKF
ncbi:MAG: hypothetical protein DA408_19175 [Bacteroidetes bacterium]|nr:MAG: hypothetical protein C7N36_12440 [Bacteroidota bacterium]PTM09096.1 MAG: hypothetical protein DA408_19175 [Bacteroidota bacterium]